MTALTITQVSKKFGLTTDTLRYYERIGLLPTVPRQKNGNRYYPQEIIDWIELVVCLRHSGVPIEKLIDYAHLLSLGDASLKAREKLLQEQLDNLKQKREELDNSIERLSYKIDLYKTGKIKDNNYFVKHK
ncbi:MerR family transcriptional regulator [Lactobacillus sp. PV034]|uniref:MerR family transcriptional regulator n=1 Tax=Lactobacillus sp. PV034 TaxID=2594495 RepID=UPI002240B920|nr:MerR family transcriptional regulator [Lactobacillus sp. PV034]QNQ81135.1 MerR family transcriptional regulator [Lactobacillus sp. PV034]